MLESLFSIHSNMGTRWAIQQYVCSIKLFTIDFTIFGYKTLMLLAKMPAGRYKGMQLHPPWILLSVFLQNTIQAQILTQ